MYIIFSKQNLYCYIAVAGYSVSGKINGQISGQISIRYSPKLCKGRRAFHKYEYSINSPWYELA